MKRLLLPLLFISCAANAAEWWETPTKAGGKIVLTLERADWCGKNLYIAYIETSQQDAIYGCWTGVNDRIHVRFNDGTRKVYDKEGWEYKNDQR
jgi:hypothetical protein